MATLVAAIKTSVFNEEQLRLWPDRTGAGPTDHPLLQPDQPDWGYRNLTQDESEAIDREHMIHMVEDAPVARPAA